MRYATLQYHEVSHQRGPGRTYVLGSSALLAPPSRLGRGASMANVRPTVVVGSRSWRPLLAPYQEPRPRRAVLQILTTLLPLAIVFVAMYRLAAFSFWWTLPLALPAAGLL